MGLTAAAAKGGRATEQNLAAFDLKTCGTQPPPGAAAKGAWGPRSPAVPQRRRVRPRAARCACSGAGGRGVLCWVVLFLLGYLHFSARTEHQLTVVPFIYGAVCIH